MNALQWKWQCNTKHDNLRIASSVVVRITQIQNMGGNYCSQLQINKQIIFDSPFSVILKYQVALRQILEFFLQFKTSRFSSPNLPYRYSDCYDATVPAKTITLFEEILIWVNNTGPPSCIFKFLKGSGNKKTIILSGTLFIVIKHHFLLNYFSFSYDLCTMAIAI